MSTEARIVFIVSDGTGITAENFSQSILAQFEATFKHIRIPFVDSVDKAHDAVSSNNWLRMPISAEFSGWRFSRIARQNSSISAW